MKQAANWLLISTNTIDGNYPKNSSEVTVVFRGPDTYISPRVYTTKQLPTWNYIIVHIKGNITLIKIQ